MKKSFMILLSIVLIVSVICVSASAAEERSARMEIMDTVEDFLESYAVETLLYTEQDLTANTIADGTVAMPIGAESRTFALSDGVSTIAQMRENISYVKAKAEYWSGMRQMQDIYRRDLELTYDFEEVTVSGNTARAVVHEYAAFTYTDCTEPSFAETIYTVDLVNLSGLWLVADVTDGDWFDAEYKNAGGFDAEAALGEFKTQLEANEPCVVTGPEISTLALTDNTFRFYNGENAAAYAYTYSGTDIDSTDFYNELFDNFKGKGGDCMNFASQCIWAGFYGSQSSGIIDARLLPMDNEGSYKWYGGKNGNSASWTGCGSFRTYIENSNNALDVGMSATIIDVPAGSKISSTVNTSSLIGAIAHVTGKDNDGNKVLYGHAIVITDVTGPSGTEIYYCAHTTNRQHVKLADNYGDSIKIIIPRAMRCGTSQENMVMADMLRPVAVGSTHTISASVNSAAIGTAPSANFGRLVISITSPSGKVSSYTADVNATKCSMSYKFEEEGLYKVECFLEFGGWTAFYVRAS